MIYFFYIFSIFLIIFAGARKKQFGEHNIKHLHISKHNEEQLTLEAQNDEATQNGLTSPFNIFLHNYNDNAYVADVLVINLIQDGLTVPYRISVDINIPFIFLTEKNHDSLQRVTQLDLIDEERDYIVNFLTPKFAAIKNYKTDIFYAMNCALRLNPSIEAEIKFFYLIGFGAEDFQKATNIEGFLGLGTQQSIPNKNNSQKNDSSNSAEKIEFNYLVLLKEQKLIRNISYSLYFGNSPGYVDSIFYIGGYQQFFIQNETQFQKLKTTQGQNQQWCFKVKYIHLIQNDTQLYKSSQTKLYTAHISSTYQFIFIPQEIADALIYHIQQDDTIQCEYSYYSTHDRNHTILQCSTKLQISIPQKFPEIYFVIQQYQEQITITLTPQQYIQKCLDDVENYAFKCYTYFAIYDSKIDLFKPDFDIIFGLPLLRVYYTYYDIENTALCKYISIILVLTQAKYYDNFQLISKFWYYSFMALLVCWAFIMMSCGIFFKDQMDQMILFVHNILKYISGDQQARVQVLMDYLADDE